MPSLHELFDNEKQKEDAQLGEFDLHLTDCARKRPKVKRLVAGDDRGGEAGVHRRCEGSSAVTCRRVSESSDGLPPPLHQPISHLLPLSYGISLATPEESLVSRASTGGGDPAEYI
ncbi:hypothetical protein EVAR_56055_1 [Eumeta japonica]|uniref:Uncharacterized protein n=1 Tax=Eumeta variegata TaxID=151549 RepID=A0A4C1Y7L3_EUMVA|nr:hypothetical protein EVAR_56055_1 [Eumeta japonica]